MALRSNRARHGWEEVSISSTQVSRATEKLDASLAAWRERPLDRTPKATSGNQRRHRTCR